MLSTLTGKNSFGLQRDLQSRVAAFVEEVGDMGLERVDGQEASFDRLQESLTSLPFLVSSKLVVLRNPSDNKQFLENYESLLSDIPETTEVIIVEPRLDKRLAYYKYLKANTDYKEYNELDLHGLATWLVTTAKQQGASLSPNDARYLLERVGVNQQLAASELEKIMIYDPHVTRRTIELLTESTPQSTIFELLEAAFNGNAKLVLHLYTEQRALKVEPQQIIAMLAWQLHILAIIKAAGDRSPETIAKDAKLSPYVVRKSQSVARKLPLTKLKSLVYDLLTIDAKSKRTALDLDDALQHYLLKLAS